MPCPEAPLAGEGSPGGGEAPSPDPSDPSEGSLTAKGGSTSPGAQQDLRGSGLC